MTEEIKEILEALKPHNDIKEYLLYLNRKQQDLLLDYIINLQKENEILKKLNICVGCENNPDYKSRCEKLKNFIINLILELNHCELNGTKKLNIVSDYIKQEYEKVLNGSDK